MRDEEDAISIKAIKFELGHVFRRMKKYVDLEENVLLFLRETIIGCNDENLLLYLARMLFY
jgi:hypothetical protein